MRALAPSGWCRAWAPVREAAGLPVVFRPRGRLHSAAKETPSPVVIDFGDVRLASRSVCVVCEAVLWLLTGSRGTPLLPYVWRLHGARRTGSLCAPLSDEVSGRDTLGPRLEASGLGPEKIKRGSKALPAYCPTGHRLCSPVHCSLQCCSTAILRTGHAARYTLHATRACSVLAPPGKCLVVCPSLSHRDWALLWRACRSAGVRRDVAWQPKRFRSAGSAIVVCQSDAWTVISSSTGHCREFMERMTTVGLLTGRSDCHRCPDDGH